LTGLSFSRTHGGHGHRVMRLTITEKLALSFGSVLLLMASLAVAAVIVYGVVSENVHSLQQETLTVCSGLEESHLECDQVQ